MICIHKTLKYLFLIAHNIIERSLLTKETDKAEKKKKEEIDHNPSHFNCLNIYQLCSNHTRKYHDGINQNRKAKTRKIRQITKTKNPLD